MQEQKRYFEIAMKHNDFPKVNLLSMKEDIDKALREIMAEPYNSSPEEKPLNMGMVSPDVEFAGIKATHVFWRNPIDQTYAARNNDIWDAVRKILMEHIDDPFTCDPRTASREEFARRNINAVVFCEHYNWKDLCYTVELMGVVQGDTLITPNGGRIENFDWAQGKIESEMLTYKDNPHPNIRMESIGEMTLNPENVERLRASLGNFDSIYDKDNDNG